MAKLEIRKKDMADGYFHARLALFVGMPLVIAFAAGIGYLTNDPILVLAAILGGIQGFFLDPDYDQRVVTVAEARIGNIPVLGWFWIGYSYGYSRTFNRKGSKIFKHRGISHWPFVGTLTRVVWYWALPFIAICALKYGISGLREIDIPWAPVFVAYLALCIQDMVHLARDLWGWQV